MTSNKVRIHSDKTPAVFLPNIEIVQASILSSPNLKRNSSLASSPLPFLPSLLDSIFLSALRYRVSMRKSIAPVPWFTGLERPERQLVNKAFDLDFDGEAGESFSLSPRGFSSLMSFSGVDELRLSVGLGFWSRLRYSSFVSSILTRTDVFSCANPFRQAKSILRRFSSSTKPRWNLRSFSTTEQRTGNNVGTSRWCPNTGQGE